MPNDNCTKPGWEAFVTACLPEYGGPLAFKPLYGDGSVRSFFRVLGTPGSWVLIVSPEPPRHEARDVDENETWVYMAALLRDAGFDVPEVYGFDREVGLILCEDAGDCLLQAEVLSRGTSTAWTGEVYGRLLETLASLQAVCGRTFRPESTFNHVYDADFSYQAEALYFARFFLGRFCGVGHERLHPELRLLAETAEEAVGERVMILRDFQSRNVMLQQPDDRLRLIDFQGARMGPSAYDVASLLYDPYVPLPQGLRDELAGNYPELLAPLAPVAASAFERSYPLVAVHRMMQVLGAYAKLSLADGKREFLAYVEPALGNLRHLLSSGGFEDFPLLRRTVEDLRPPKDATG